LLVRCALIYMCVELESLQNLYVFLVVFLSSKGLKETSNAHLYKEEKNTA